MTEQLLIEIINTLIDAELEAGSRRLKPDDIARRAIEQCGGEGVFTIEAVTGLVNQICSFRFEPSSAEQADFDKVEAIARRALDENHPELTLGDALRLLAERGDEEARRALEVVNNNRGRFVPVARHEQ